VCELLTKRDFLIKVNKSPRFHNPHNSLTPQRLFAAKTPFQLDRIFLFTLNNCGHAFETNSFRQHETFWNGENYLDKKQNKARRKSMNFIVIEGKILTKVTRGCGSITANQLSENEAASASSLDVSAVSKKTNRKQKKAMLRESDFQKRVQIIIRRRILHCTKRMPPCIFETTMRYFLLGLFLFCGSTFSSLLFCPLLTTAKTCASLNPRSLGLFLF